MNETPRLLGLRIETTDFVATRDFYSQLLGVQPKENGGRGEALAAAAAPADGHSGQPDGQPGAGPQTAHFELPSGFTIRVLEATLAGGPPYNRAHCRVSLEFGAANLEKLAAGLGRRPGISLAPSVDEPASLETHDPAGNGVRLRG